VRRPLVRLESCWAPPPTLPSAVQGQLAELGCPPALLLLQLAVGAGPGDWQQLQVPPCQLLRPPAAASCLRRVLLLLHPALEPLCRWARHET
jgi:hypothetical protein